MLKLETRHRTNARMRERVSHIFLTLLLLLCKLDYWVVFEDCSCIRPVFLLMTELGVYESHCDLVRDAEAVAPDVATGVNPQPFLPLLAPSPLTPFTNNSVPALSGTRSNKFIRKCLTNRHFYVMENVEKHMMVRYMFQDSVH
ncbi:hypothetical protein DVH24_032327 [Malus domestica]|uniref:Uncharacterized protein n=1 Tax=Malus domestica TaxID=3750 RepID=A0A498J3B3_MALDO|nr:hypothetical protein DVH24_032327 [Malus domestica]